MRLRRERSPSRSADSFEELFEANWRILAEAILAAYRRDRTEHDRHVLRFTTSEVPFDGRSGMFAGLALRYRLLQLLGAKAAQSDVDRLCGEISIPFTALTGESSALMNDMVHTVLEIPGGTKVSGAKLLVHGSAMTGLLLADAAKDVPALKAGVWRYLDDNRKALED